MWLRSDLSQADYLGGMARSADNSFTIGRIAGAPVRIGPGSVLIGVYIAYSLGRQWSDQSSIAVVTAAAIFTGLAFLGSIIAHEAGHALVAKRNGVRALEIRLSLFGGAAALDRGAPDPTTEMKIAGAGPAVNLGLAVALLGGLYGLSAAGISGLLLDALLWIGAINLILGLFNLLPGLPLDGGSVLTGYLWRRRNDRTAAVRTTARVGKFLGYAAFAFAAYELFVLRSPFGLYSGFLGMLFIRGADGELTRASLVDHVRGHTVNDVAQFQPPVIDEAINTAAARALLPPPSRNRWAIVRDSDGVARGLLDLVALDKAATADGTNPVSDVMFDIDQSRAAFSTESLEDVLARGVLVPFVVINEKWQPVALVESLNGPASPVA